MAEPVRLVVWDLDDTLWSGILSEGPVTQISERRAAIKALARRGILSTVCSRSDFSRARATLEAEGLWEFLVFPSIDWEPKGPRIRALIETFQLRAASVLFIDDNPSNLEEARHYNPDLQVAGVEFIARMLDEPLLAGKADPDLIRLRQYQALARRSTDAENATEGVESFLRQCDIRVDIRYDLTDSLDRVIELINRTNQLNFTKRRLSDDASVARRELQSLLQSHEVQAGLLHVADRYGDHGDAGFYLLRNATELLYFCFSCRILGMGVETWLYRRLGRPRLAVHQGVASDPVKDAREIDWIRLVDPSGQHADPKSAHPHLNWVAARGGCDLQALSHYFRLGSENVMGEFNVGRNGFDARVDHSMFLRYAVEGISIGSIEEASRLGYKAEDFRTSLTEPHEGTGLIILSFWTDVSYALYRHRGLGFVIPFALPGRSDHRLDARTGAVEELPEDARREWIPQALLHLQSDYEYLGPIDEQLFKENLRIVLETLSPTAHVVLLQSNTRLRETNGMTHTSTDNLRFNRWLSEAASHHPRAVLVDIREVISSETEVLDWTHFDRIVYYRLFQRILQLTE